MSQLAVVKLRLAGDTVAAPVSPEDTDTLTFALGCVASFTVKSPLPASPTLSVGSLTTRFAVSSSVMVTMTDAIWPP